MENEIQCPKCSSTQLTANKKGFSVAKAAGGVILTGGVGVLAGAIGSNKIKITCLSCGYQFKPGEDKAKVEQRKQAIAYKVQSYSKPNSYNKPKADMGPAAVILIIIIMFALAAMFIL